MGHLSVSAAAKQLGISEKAVYKRIKEGSLEAAKLNGRWLIEEQAVASALASPPKRGRPWPKDSYLLMNGPYPVMEFAYRPDSGSFSPGEVLDALRAPLGTVGKTGRGKAAGLEEWWSHRSIPGSRAGLDERLRKLGLNDPAQIPFRNLGLSLSDQYWVCPAGEALRWEDVNYFQNGFGNSADDWDEWLAEVGLSSPDNTSEGALPKRWICTGDGRILLKGHVPWTDQQVYNEVVATRLHERLLARGDYVPYCVKVLDGPGAVSACPCFVSSREEYVPMSRALDADRRRQGETTYDTVVRVCVQLGIREGEVERHLAQMIVCDGILANTDRHLRNFGLIRNIDDLTWRFAPLFDSGNGLWYDKDEGAVARGDHSFVARPFDSNPTRQLMCASATEWLDPSALDGFAEEACEILAEGDLSRWRLDYLRDGIQARINVVTEICG